MKLKMLTGTAALAFAAPALAQGALAEGPPVEGGDMACMVASGYIAMAAAKAADKPDATPERRAGAAKISAQGYQDNAFYLGRMTTFGKDRLSRDYYLETYARFVKLSSKDQSAIIKVCNEWARDAKVGIIKPWTSNP